MCESMSLCDTWYRERVHLDYGDMWRECIQAFPNEWHGPVTGFQAARLIYGDAGVHDVPTVMDFGDAFQGEWESFDDYAEDFYKRALMSGAVRCGQSFEDVARVLDETCLVVGTTRGTVWVYKRYCGDLS